MLKIYTDLSHYQPANRKYLSDLLRPFLPNNRSVEFGIQGVPIKFVKEIKDCDCCLLPMSWNYYLSNNTISVAEKFLEKAETYNRKTLVWYTGDHYSALYRKNIIIFRQSCYDSKKEKSEFTLPVFIRDPLGFKNQNQIFICVLELSP